MQNKLKKMIRPVYRFLLGLMRLNIVKTIYLNVKCLPLAKAVKLPIYLYGSVKFHSLKGRLVIEGPIKSGMIKIGYRWFDLWPTAYLPTQLWISGTLIFRGGCIVSGGAGIFVPKKDALITVGKSTLIGAGTMMKSMNKLYIGNYTRITGNCTIMNSNMHYVKNIDTGTITRNDGMVRIGAYCWINSGTTITKGTVIPDYSIVARNSFLSKDYSLYGGNAFIVGSPAKVKSNNVQRIFDLEKEKEMNEFFYGNPNIDVYNDSVGLYEDKGENNEIK